MNGKLLLTLKSQMEALGIQFLFLKEPYESICGYDYGFRKRLWQNADYSLLIEILKNAARPKTLFHFRDFFCAYYSFFSLPENSMDEYGYTLCLIGPVLFAPATKETFARFIDEFTVPPERHQDVREFYNRIPLLPDMDFWDALLLPVLSSILGGKIDVRVADMELPATFYPDYRDYQYNPDSDISLSLLEERYRVEAEMLKAVSEGNTDLAVQLHHQFRQFRLMPRTPVPLRDAKNIIIVLNTLLRKAVQVGGVHPYHIDNISAKFAIQIESCATIDQVRALSPLMVHKYCELVNNHSRKDYSTLVQFCLDYIDSHYKEQLSLNNLSQLCSVSKNYLSGLFHKETGLTVTDYINTTRVRQSLIFLTTTPMSINDIAAQCGFADANYYSRIFKKYQGITPTEYREQMRQKK